MTAMAASPQARAGTAPPGAVTPRRRMVPVASMRNAAAKSMLRLADHVSTAHPKLETGQHVRDAVRTLQAGDEEAAQRHLKAAAFSLTPQSLLRHGIHDDRHHISARQAMGGVHRHLLLVKDIAGAKARNEEARNQALISRQATQDATTSRPLPSYGGDPGALAQKPVARQPGGDRALNAPARTNAGRVDPNVANPRGRQPRGSRQFARSWDEVAAVIDLSARTAMLEVTPAPRGHPGGPGLYDVRGMGHDPYFQQIVKALIEKRGMPPDRAYKIAWGALRRWRRGGGHVHPEVRAAAAKTLLSEAAKGARAKAMHGHA